MPENMLVENPTWTPGIYQIETDDPVVGGPDGISNRQARELANRTGWLKQELEAGTSALTTHEAGNNHPLATTGAKGMVVLATVAEAIAGVLANKVVTPEGLHAAVQSAVATLVNSSPATLDTLGEIATALGNDPNLATTLTNLIATKAGLASPALTGIPTAPTAAAGTNTTQIATTAFVLSQLLVGGYLSRSVPDVLTAGYWTEPVPITIVGGHAGIDVAEGNVFPIAVNANFTLDFPAGMAGKAGMMLVVAAQDNVGGRTLTLASGYRLAAGEWSVSPNAVNLLWITSDGGGAVLDVVIAQRGS